MHIPDGYLNIPTCAAAFVVMAPIWAISTKKLNASFEAKQVPLISLGAAFSFVLMMFNFPLPGGSSGHAVGGAILAILLGPWAAVSILSVVLAIQALLFHDGGLTTFAANAFNMAFVLPFASYWIYRLFGHKNATLFRRGLAGALAGYFGLTLSALSTAIILGIQPHGASGYAPYPLNITVPVMVGSYLLVFGWVEGFITAFVLAWSDKTFSREITEIVKPPEKTLRFGWIAVSLLVLLSPLGLLVQGTAFGEWSEQELTRFLGYVPSGIRGLSKTWGAPLSGYHIQGHSLAYGYFLSALIGVFATGLFAFVLGRVLARKSYRHSAISYQKSTIGYQNNIQEKIIDLGYFFAHNMLNEKFQKQKGLLQRCDPRFKIIFILALVIFSAWIKSYAILGILLALAIELAILSRIQIGWFIRYVVLTMFLFSFLIALPAAFTWITPGKPWMTIYPKILIISQPGIRNLALFVLRATTAIAFGSLLTLTTPWFQLLNALEVLRVPSRFIFMLEMAYRYIFLLVRLIDQMRMARMARMIALVPIQVEQEWIAGRIGFLLQRSFDLSEQVYSAMLARGYDIK